MNIPDEPLRSVDRELLDQLVDGELSDTERQELLARLDAEPDGWRRCALAFLEAQSWRESLGPVAREAKPDDFPALAPAHMPNRWRRGPSVLALSGWAAGVLIAFTVGLAAGAAWKTAAREVPSDDMLTSRPPSSDRESLAALGESLTTAKPDAVVTAAEPDRTAGIAQDAGASLPQVRTVALLAWGADNQSGTYAYQVPILEGPGLDEQWLRDQPPALSEYVQRQLERRGYEIEQHRQLWSVNLAAGQRLTIPVDEVKLRYVGHRSVQ